MVRLDPVSLCSAARRALHRRLLVLDTGVLRLAMGSGWASVMRHSQAELG